MQSGAVVKLQAINERIKTKRPSAPLLGTIEIQHMANYLIGDVQGCDAALQGLLDAISFSPSRDTLFLLGDLVNRGPNSVAVLRRLMGYGAAARSLLGNHDLHLLAIAHGVREPNRHDTLDDILHAADRSALLGWLCQQGLALLEKVGDETILMVHAGVLPAWTASKTLALAREVQTVLRGPELHEFLHQMYGNEPTGWDESLTGAARLRVIVNALTRLRFCTPQGQMEFETKEAAGAAPPGYLPWFDVPGRQTANVTVAFGHWSTLGRPARADLLALDTGCVWGGHLSAVRLAAGSAHELIQVKCPALQTPGAT
jgi:bis(5'-nucleosyl)-tetraphosphatase (symmetrical)